MIAGLQEIPAVASPVPRAAVSPSVPLGDGGSVLIAGCGGQFLGGQVLFGNFLKADGHGDDSLAVDTHFHPGSANR